LDAPKTSFGPWACPVSAGARCIQVFDSWVGALGPDDYVRFVQPYSRALIERIRATGVSPMRVSLVEKGKRRFVDADGNIRASETG
jgi:uroporphyrinogen decarboxylase